jgi:hypothetical protein
MVQEKAPKNKGMPLSWHRKYTHDQTVVSRLAVICDSADADPYMRWEPFLFGLAYSEERLVTEL